MFLVSHVFLNPQLAALCFKIIMFTFQKPKKIISNNQKRKHSLKIEEKKNDTFISSGIYNLIKFDFAYRININKNR